jgi:nucleotide-binding universal stress UspA family protein
MTVPAEPTIFGSVATDVMSRVEKAHAEMKREAGEYLEKVAQPLRADGLTVATHAVIEDQPGVAILQNAKAPIDMIAIETHGRGAISRMLLGSTADKVIRGSKLPILIHKPVH